MRGWGLTLLASLALVACKHKATVLAPEPAEAGVVASASAAPPAMTASASAAPSAAPAPPELSADVEKRVERWKARLIKDVVDSWPYKDQQPLTMGPEAVTTENSRYGVFDVISASVPTPVMAGGAEDTHDLLIVTPQGQLALQSAPTVVGLCDINGDGRPDLVLSDVTVVADMPNGPLPLKIAAKGGAFGWRECRIATFEDKPAIIATTETNTSHDVGELRAGGYTVHQSKGLLEEVTLRWDGKRLVQAARAPIETPDQAAARQKEFADEAKKDADLRTEVKNGCIKGCPARCDSDKNVAACITACKSSCGNAW
jgi:hypothetical protein